MRNKGTQDESGFAAVVIAMVLVTVLCLIVVGFSSLINNEKKESLNRQLSSAAYYAAESGVNDAVAALSAGYATPKITCAPLSAPNGPGSSFLMDNHVDAATASTANYPCLLIFPAPFDLQFSSVGAQDDNARTFIVHGIDPTDPNEAALSAVGSFTVSWQDEKGIAGYDTTYFGSLGAQFPTAASWGGKVGVLQLQIVPLGSGTTSTTSIDPATMQHDSFNVFLYPTTSGSGSVTYAASNTDGSSANVVIGGRCSNGQTPRHCSVTINGLGGLNTSHFLFRLASIYNTSTVTITANNGSSTQIRLGGVQNLIDSTGKSQDVLRRIQVRVPDKNYNIPQFSLQSLSGICKQLVTYPPNFASSSCQPSPF